MILDKDSQKPTQFNFSYINIKGEVRNVQEKYYNLLSTEYDNFNGVREIVLKARQEGISSFVLALFTVDFLMNPWSVSICISHRKDSTDLLFKKVKFYIDSYCEKKKINPKTFLKSDNKNLIENATNNAVFYIGTAGAKVGGRGGSCKNILFCLDGNQLVVGKDGFVMPIKDFPKTVRDGNGALIRVFDLAKRIPNEDMASIILAGSPQLPIKGTLSHKLFCRGGNGQGEWKKIKDITKDDYVGFPITQIKKTARTKSPFSFELTKDFGEFCGWYLTGGSMGKNRIDLAINTKEKEYIKNLLHRLNIKHSFYTRGNGTAVYICNVQFRKTILSFLGEKEAKRIPDKVWGFGEEFIIGLLRGLFLGDGCDKIRGIVTFSSIRPQLVVQLKRLLISLRVGYPCIYITKVGSQKTRNNKEIWRIGLSGKTAANFRKIVGFSTETRTDKRNNGYNKYFLEGLTHYWAKVKKIEKIERSDMVYDIVLDKDPHSFCLTSGISSNSEAAFYADTELITAQEMIMGTAQQVPLGSGMIFIESTANGLDNYYQQTWEQAQRGQVIYKPRFFGWKDYYSKEWITEKRKEFPNEAMFSQEYPSCVAGNTRFSSKKGIVEFKKIKEAEKGVNETLTLKTKQGRIITTTPNHLFMTPSGEWKRIDNLRQGDKLSLLPPVFNKEYQNISLDLGLPILRKSLKIDNDLALFLGFYMGDGSLHKGKKGSVYTLGIVFDAKDLKSISTCEILLVKLFGRFTKRIVGNKKGGVELRVSSKYLGEFADSLNLIYRNDNGNIKRLIHVPDFILKSPQSVVKNFLRGLFDADGFSAYTSPRIVFFSKYDEFIRDVQLLLLGFGITSRINIATKKAGDGHLHAGRELALRKLETEKFMEEIGFVSERKNNRWNNRVIKTKFQHNVLPIIIEDAVSSIEKGITQMVYDEEIIPEHYYSANGFYVHNSPDDAFISTGTPYFDNQILKVMLDARHEPITKGKFAADGNIDIISQKTVPVRLYRELEYGEQIVVFADPAEAKDFCAAVALSKKHYDCPLVFNDIIESSQFGYELNAMCKFINLKTGMWPKLAVERNTGQATIYVLKTLNYPDLFRMVDFSATNSHEGGGIGWTTTGHMAGGELQGTRRKMLDDEALALKQGSIKMYDEIQIRQHMSFMMIKGRAQAKSNKKDDFCFVAGTKILTKEGQVPIENIKVGDLVLTRNGYKHVIKTMNRHKEVINNIGLTGTPSHPIFTVKGVKRLNKVEANDIIYMWNQKTLSIENAVIAPNGKPLFIEEKNTIDIQIGKRKVYNLQIADSPEYFANNILVHNCMATAGAWQVQLLTPSTEFGDYDAEERARVREKWRFR